MTTWGVAVMIYPSRGGQSAPSVRAPRPTSALVEDVERHVGPALPMASIKATVWRLIGETHQSATRRSQKSRCPRRPSCGLVSRSRAPGRNRLRMRVPKRSLRRCDGGRTSGVRPRCRLTAAGRKRVGSPRATHAVRKDRCGIAGVFKQRIAVSSGTARPRVSRSPPLYLAPSRRLSSCLAALEAHVERVPLSGRRDGRVEREAEVVGCGAGEIAGRVAGWRVGGGSVAAAAVGGGVVLEGGAGRVPVAEPVAAGGEDRCVGEAEVDPACGLAGGDRGRCGDRGQRAGLPVPSSA